MKEQTRNTEVQIDEEEIGKLPEKEFRKMSKAVKIAWLGNCWMGSSVVYFLHWYSQCHCMLNLSALPRCFSESVGTN